MIHSFLPRRTDRPINPETRAREIIAGWGWANLADVAALLDKDPATGAPFAPPEITVETVFNDPDPAWKADLQYVLAQNAEESLAALQRDALLVVFDHSAPVIAAIQHELADLAVQARDWAEHPPREQAPQIRLWDDELTRQDKRVQARQVEQRNEVEREKTRVLHELALAANGAFTASVARYAEVRALLEQAVPLVASAEARARETYIAEARATNDLPSPEEYVPVIEGAAIALAQPTARLDAARALSALPAPFTVAQVVEALTSAPALRPFGDADLLTISQAFAGGDEEIVSSVLDSVLALALHRPAVTRTPALDRPERRFVFQVTPGAQPLLDLPAGQRGATLAFTDGSPVTARLGYLDVQTDFPLTAIPEYREHRAAGAHCTSWVLADMADRAPTVITAPADLAAVADHLVLASD